MIESSVVLLRPQNAFLLFILYRYTYAQDRVKIFLLDVILGLILIFNIGFPSGSIILQY